MTQSRRDFSQGKRRSSGRVANSSAQCYSPLIAGISTPLSQFGYGDVELLEGPLRQQFQTNHAFYAALDEDSLLKPYRQRAGLPAPGEDMGGWYSWENNGFAPGHSFGQYLSGLSRDYAATGAKSRRKRSIASSATSRPLSRPTSGMTIASRLTLTTKSPSACSTRTSSRLLPMHSRYSIRRSTPFPRISRPAASRAPSNMPDRTKTSHSAGTSLTRFRKINCSRFSAGQATVTAISPIHFPSRRLVLRSARGRPGCYFPVSMPTAM
jgi:hypothetical protein